MTSAPSSFPCMSHQAVFQASYTVGTVKANLSRPKQLLMGFLASAFIAFGGLLAIVVGKSNTSLAAANPGLAKLVFASVFPVGIVLVVIAGAELFTGNVGILTP